MCMKQNGYIKYEYECTSSSARKGRTKLSLGILCMMFGPDKPWMELGLEMSNAICEARINRGAGDKPLREKYDPDFLAPGN